MEEGGASQQLGSLPNNTRQPPPSHRPLCLCRPAINLINFRYLQGHQRIAYINVWGVLWNAFLRWDVAPMPAAECALQGTRMALAHLQLARMFLGRSHACETPDLIIISLRLLVVRNKMPPVGRRQGGATLACHTALLLILLRTHPGHWLPPSACCTDRSSRTRSTPPALLDSCLATTSHAAGRTAWSRHSRWRRRRRKHSAAGMRARFYILHSQPKGGGGAPVWQFSMSPPPIRTASAPSFFMCTYSVVTLVIITLAMLYFGRQ